MCGSPGEIRHYIVKVKLRGKDVPSNWRRIAVPCACTCEELVSATLDSLGWDEFDSWTLTSSSRKHTTDEAFEIVRDLFTKDPPSPGAPGRSAVEELRAMPYEDPLGRGFLTKHVVLDLAEKYRRGNCEGKEIVENVIEPTFPTYLSLHVRYRRRFTMDFRMTFESEIGLDRETFRFISRKGANPLYSPFINLAMYEGEEFEMTEDNIYENPEPHPLDPKYCSLHRRTEPYGTLPGQKRR